MTAAGRKQGRGEPDGADADGRGDARERILRAAHEVFVREGFAGTTTLAVARQARASKETVYGLFASKEQLLEALFAWRATQIFQLLPDPTTGVGVGTGTDATLAGWLAEFGLAYLTVLTRPSVLEAFRFAASQPERFPTLRTMLADILDRRPAALLAAGLSRLGVGTPEPGGTPALGAAAVPIGTSGTQEAAGAVSADSLAHWYLELLGPGAILRCLIGGDATPDQSHLRRRAAVAAAFLTTLIAARAAVPNGSD